MKLGVAERRRKKREQREESPHRLQRVSLEDLSRYGPD